MDDRNLALEMARVTEAAALASAREMGRGDRRHADHVAVEAMRRAFDRIDVRGTVVIGEGERDEAPMLYIGEKVGAGWEFGSEKSPKVDIAVDPLEGTNLCATGAPDAIAVIALADDGKFLNAPDTYMEKIAVGPEARGVIDLRESWTWNLHQIAKAKDRDVTDLTAIILDRDRHRELIGEVRQAGARIRLIGDGDVSAAIATCKDDTGIDVLFGTGGAPEGVIAAAALRCGRGDMQGRLCWRSPEERERGRKMGIDQDDVIYGLEDLAQGNVMFAATGVTSGSFLKGVNFFGGGATTQSVVMRSKSGTIRFIDTTHHFESKPAYSWFNRPA
jgi:fructose-1,6-bisphosphatase class II